MLRVITSCNHPQQHRGRTAHEIQKKKKKKKKGSMDKPPIQTVQVLDDSTDPAIKLNNCPAIMFPKDRILWTQVHFISIEVHHKILSQAQTA